MAKMQGAAPQEGQVVARRDGHVEVQGRGGEVLSRRSPDVGDEFHIPEHTIPRGWRYQWIAESIFGDEHVTAKMRSGMHNNGWRPVPHERHPELFGTGTGAIRWGGLVLAERPASLDDEAKAEELAKARQQMADRQQMGNPLRQAMPDGFTANHKGAQPRVNISIDPGVDIERPHYQTEGGE